MRSTRGISAAQLHELKADIRAELLRVERTLTRELVDESLVGPGGGAPRATSVFGSDGELTATLFDRVHARHLELTEALRRIEDGRYGVCGRCGQGIAYGRLLAVPEATNCLACRQ